MQDDAPDTWEVKENVAENVLRDYEDKWWGACRDVRAPPPRHAALRNRSVLHRNQHDSFPGRWILGET